MADEEDQKLRHVLQLEDILDAVLQVAQLILRDERVTKSLNSTESGGRLAYWRAFFQVVLSHPFGTVAPEATEWQEFAKILDGVRITTLRKREDLRDRIKKYWHWCEANNTYSLYAVAQFWNADDQRAPAFVVNPSPGRPEVAKIEDPLVYEYAGELSRVYQYWTESWAVMDLINNRDTNEMFNPVSLGNFIVRRSHELNDTCPLLQLHVGPSTSFQRFQEHPLPRLAGHNFSPPNIQDTLDNTDLADLFAHLDVPGEIVQALLHAPFAFPGQHGKDALLGHNAATTSIVKLLETLTPEQQAEQITAIADDDENGAPLWDGWNLPLFDGYLQYFFWFFLWKYYFNLGSRGTAKPPRLEQLRLMLLNNLLIARALIPEASASDVSHWHYQYFLPTWFKSTSYLALITRGRLEDAHLGCFRKFAERLFGLAWAHDSARKLDEDTARLTKQAERAARAAILARNFSHTVGSHVLSNPGFAMVLTRGRGGDRLEGALRDLSNAFNDCRDNYIMGERSPEPSYLEHWLQLVNTASEALHDGLGEAQAFYRFLQGRFDFIACAIEDRRDPPEPLCFVEDLVNDFLSQTAFLDYLVRDLGWGLHDLSIGLYLPSDSNAKVQSDVVFRSRCRSSDGPIPYKFDWVSSDVTHPTVGDFTALIGAPGGTTGAHAFYAILENVIRNSFKYGSVLNTYNERNAAYMLSLRLCRRLRDGRWQLQIWDNFSKAGDANDEDSPFRVITERLKQSIVRRETLELATEGFGIKEMQIAARTLCAQPNSTNGDCGALRLIHPSQVEEVCPAALKTDKSERGVPLVFEMSLNEPVLLAIYTKTDRQRADSPWIRSYCNLSDLGQSGAHLALVLGDDIGDLLERLRDVPSTLPYRLLVIYGSMEQKLDLESMIQVSRIPPRRLHCFYDSLGFRVSGKSLYEFMNSEQWPTDLEAPDGQGAADWIFCAYEAWLRAWKGTPDGGKWHLWIGLERSSEIVAETWGKWLIHGGGLERSAVNDPQQSDSTRRYFHSDLITMVVRSRIGDETATWLSDPESQLLDEDVVQSEYWEQEYRLPHSKKKALVFDNHGRCFPATHEAQKALDYRGSTRFYQETSGGRSFELVQRLISPPTSFFGFGFFVYNLVESCLAIVAVADERVAADLLFNSDELPSQQSDSGTAEGHAHLADRLAAYQKAGGFPIFQLNRAPANSSPAHYITPIGTVRLFARCWGRMTVTILTKGYGLRVSAFDSPFQLSQGRSILWLVETKGQMPMRKHQACLSIFWYFTKVPLISFVQTTE